MAMPGLSSPALAQRCSELGAKVVVCGDTLGDAVDYAAKVTNDDKQFVLRFILYPYIILEMRKKLSGFHM